MVLAVAVVWLLWRGAWRGVTGGVDFTIRYHGAREWLAGRDPYEFPDVTEFALRPTSLVVDFPPTLLTLVPLAPLSWPDARLLFALVNVAAVIFIAVGVARLAGWPLLAARTLMVMALVIALSATITTIAMGQTGLLATAAIIAAMLLERSGHKTASGAVFGIAAVVKIQLGLPFLAYLLWRRRWSPILASVAVVAGFTAIAVARMELAEVPWTETWLSNISYQTRPGGIQDPGPLNVENRLALVNLQYPLSALISNPTVVQVSTLIAVGVAALTFVWLRRGRDARPDLLAMAVVAVLSLLVAYHRYYDAVLLAVPMAWACSALSGSNWRLGAVVLALCATFLVPLQSLLRPSYLGASDIVPAWLAGSAFWNAVVLAPYSWTLVLMVGLLLMAAARERSSGEVAAESGSKEALGGGVVSP